MTIHNSLAEFIGNTPLVKLNHIPQAAGVKATIAVKVEYFNPGGSSKDRIAERITQLGGEPDFNPATLLQRSHADYNASNDLKEMIRANLIAERVAIEAYSQMVDLIGDKDPTTKRLVEQILNDEQEHAEELKTWLAL